MASTSKGRASSRKKSSTGKARVISTKRKDALPRTGGVTAERRKPVVLPPIDAPTEPPATEVAALAPKKKKAHSLHQKGPAAGRKKTTRAAGRTSATLDEPVATEVAQAVAAAPEVPEMVEAAPPAIEPAMVTAPEPVADPVVAVEPPATAYEEFTVTPPEAPQVEALAVVETEVELEVEASAIVEELPVAAATAPSIAIGPPPIPEETRTPPMAHTTAERRAPAPRAPHHERRSLMPGVGRLLSTLFRWTGISGPK